jgi:hypothetical protein
MISVVPADESHGTDAMDADDTRTVASPRGGPKGLGGDEARPRFPDWGGGQTAARAVMRYRCGDEEQGWTIR